MAGTKRGSHLALSLERLENLVAESRRRDAMDRNDGESKVSDDSGNEPLLQRIGLSATVNPPEEAARFLTGGRPVTIVNPGGRPAMDLRMVEPLENMRDLQSVNAKQRVGGVDSERPTPHISGVTPAMQRLAERKGIVQTGDSGLSAGGNGVLVGGEAGAGGDDALLSGERTTGGAFDSAVLVGAAGDEILAHRTTLVFVNSRGVAEKLTARLNDLYAQTRHEVDPDLVRDMGSPEGREGFASHYDAVVGSTTMLVGSHEGDDVIAMAHHGSVSKERRKMIEERLKRGELRCVVATSSLELGIDMGSVDLVIQIDTPLSVSSGLQRVGRADHQVGGVSHALFYPLTRQQIVTGAASLESMIAGDIELLAVLKNPLDVLAQQTVAAAVMHDLKADDWYVTGITVLSRHVPARRKWRSLQAVRFLIEACTPWYCLRWMPAKGSAVWANSMRRWSMNRVSAM